MKQLQRVFLLFLPILVIAQVACSTPGRGDHLRMLDDMSARDYFSDDASVRIAEQIGKGRGPVQQSDLVNADLDREGKEGMTLLMWAMAKRDYDGVSALLSAGADPNVTTSSNAMWLAVVLEDTKVLELLLAHGGDPESIDSETKRSLIFEAALHGRLQNIEVLKSAGVDMNQQNLSGNTVLSYAISFKAYDIALALLDMGVDPFIEDRWGYDSFKVLSQFGDKGVEKGSSTYQDYLRLKDEFKTRARARSN